MSGSAIKVENLSKRFFIGASQEKATTFYDAVTATVSAPWRRFQALSQKSEAVEEFWALQDIEFAIEAMQVWFIAHSVGVLTTNKCAKLKRHGFARHAVRQLLTILVQHLD